MRRIGWFLVVAVATASPASAQEARRHVVVAGESCSSIAQRYYGDPRFVDLLHGANPELGKKPPPHALREGMVLVVPPKPAGAPSGAAPGADAELTAVQNRTFVLAPDPKPGKPNDPLFRGNRVSTEAASAADVTFRDETQVKLGERTLVVILGDARSAAARVGAPDAQATLVTGNLRALMASVKSSATVATEAAKVKVYDGEAQVSVAPSAPPNERSQTSAPPNERSQTSAPRPTTRLAVYHGSSTIDASGKTREVARGFGSKAELGKEPTEPRPLPPAPAWSTPPPLVLVLSGDEHAAIIAGEYRVAAPTTGRIAEWHVQIARDGIFRDVAFDARVPAATTRLEGHVPSNGRYYVRVSAIDDDHFEGPFGPTARTLVVQATKTAIPGSRLVSIAIDPSDAFCVRVGNVPLTRIEGQPIVVPKAEPVRVRCAPSKTDPTTSIDLQ
jgi:hypothetical protein